MTLYVEVAPGCGTSWTTEFSLSGSQQASQSDPYLQANIDLSAYVGTNIRLRLRGVTGSSWSGDMAVDDVQVSASVLICGCDDAVFCNGQETCAGSTCVAGSPIDCEDGISCTTGVCNEGTRSCDQSAGRPGVRRRESLQRDRGLRPRPRLSADRLRLAGRPDRSAFRHGGRRIRVPGRHLPRHLQPVVRRWNL